MKKFLVAIVLTLVAFAIYSVIIYDYKGFTIVANLYGEIYKLDDNWYPIGTETYTTKVWLEYLEPDEAIIPGKPNRKVIRFKNDKEDLFISYDSVIDRVYNLHKVNHELPVIYSDQVEKVVLTYTEKGDIILKGEVLDSYLEWLRTYFEGKKLRTAACVTDVSGFRIYFKDDFPAYYDGIERINKTSTGELGVSKLEGYSSIDDCVVLPDLVEEYILDQLR